jgi:PPOX class probable F420-dependent enzyme
MEQDATEARPPYGGPMRLDDEEGYRRLVAADHGVLATLHPERGADLVPVCFAVSARTLVVPIDEVKPKTSTALARTTNLDRDPRATLLVERWDADDWSRLWWVRAELRRLDEDGDADALADLLVEKYRAYRGAPFAALLRFDVVALTGWSAGP